MNKLFLKVMFALGLSACVVLIVQLYNTPQQPYTFSTASTDGTGKFYMGREIAGMISGHGAIEWLERNDREETEKPQVVIKSMGLKSTEVVADIGAGSGYFTFRIAALVPQGKVYAVEIGPEMLDYLERKKQELRIENVIVQPGEVDDTRLPAGSIDIAFMVDAYHEFSYPREMMRSIVRALKPGGRVIFVEYRGEDPDLPIKPLHKMTIDQLKKEMNAVGLRWTSINNELPSQHISTFIKP